MESFSEVALKMSVYAIGCKPIDSYLGFYLGFKVEDWNLQLESKILNFERFV